MRIERSAQKPGLVLGGTVVLAFDPDNWQPTAENTADYRKSVEQGFGYGPDQPTPSGSSSDFLVPGQPSVTTESSNPCQPPQPQASSQLAAP
ncbi:hypothetical protein [Streptomyces flaveolus]|uniref:hypothetical protein n=1 Tax=Streptomyces flaveolus TaxID=67297 RepID=UPI0033259C8D